MKTYDLTQKQKELLKIIVQQMKSGVGSEPLIPVVGIGGDASLSGIRGDFDHRLLGDLAILADAGLLKSQFANNHEVMYYVKQSAYDAVENDFVLPDNEPQKNINTGGGAYIGGNISVNNGDYIGRDKIIQSGGISIGGNAKANIIISGDGNTVTQKSSYYAFRDLSKLLEQIQNSLNDMEGIEIDANAAAEIRSDLVKVQEEMNRQIPNKLLMLKRLKSSFEYVSLITNHATIGKLLEKSVYIATEIFEGK